MNSALQTPDLSVAEKRALLADLLRQKAARPTTMPTSFAQQRLWFLSRLEPDSPAYNIPRPLRLRGALDVSVLRETFNRILARHEVLRGRFDIAGGEPVQIIQPRVEIELPLIDLQDLSETEREMEVSRRAIADAEQPFDLTKAPLLRLCLLKLEPEEHVLLLTMHHIVSDGWSMGVLVRELKTNYEALLAGQQPDLPPLPIQYGDFARWQREWLQGEVLDEQLNYWKDKLSGAPPVLNLPVMRSRPATQTINGSHLVIDLSTELTRNLKELSRQEGVTLFMTLLAAFKTLLYRYSGEQDIVVGSPIAGRNRAELEDLIGFFVNALPMRTSLAGQPSFRELLARVKETALGAFAHQELPFEKLVEGVQPPRSLSHTPIFQIMFALQNQPAASFALRGIEIEAVKREYDTAKFDLTLFVTERDEQLGCWLEYNTDLFSETAVSQLLNHFETLLNSIVLDPEQKISQLTLLAAHEKQLLASWSGTEASFPSLQSIHQMFENQVRKSPHEIALIAGASQLTYDELNQRSNQLARHLRELGVGPDTRVAICLDRSAELVIAVLGTLKAGGAYVPMDPSYPSERLAFTLRDSEARVLIADEKLATALPDSEAQRVFMRSQRQSISRLESTNLPVLTQPENLAYVIYTSGSTGQPKGVAIEHRSTIAFLQWALATFTQEQLSTVLFSTSVCFDLSVFEMFAPLCGGGKVAVAENALQLPELSKSGITLVNTVPSAMTELVRVNGIPTSVKTINLAGEPLLKSLVDEIYRTDSVASLLNLYGPSEDTTYSTYTIVKKGSAEEPHIGKPIANSAAYILDAELQQVPMGVVGELFLAGAGLARCYLNRPDLTAEKFVPDPFSRRAGARMYRTGDKARYRSDGTIDFLGRLDHQIKLRGFRIELGEIEAALRQQPAVEDAVVVVRESGQSRDLVAYVATGNLTSEQETIGELRSALRQKLPEYMLPSYFVLLDKLPLTANGKIDRRALPAIDRTRSDPGHRNNAPRNSLEDQLTEIWKETLELDTIGLDENFFEIGGHSLLAVRLIAEIEQRLGQKLPLVSLFQNTTIASLAEVLSQDLDSRSWPALIQIQKGKPKTTPLFCVSMPNVNALGYVALARHLGPEQIVYGLQAQYPEDLQGEHSQYAVDELATEYLEAVRRVQPHGPYQFMGMCRGAHIAFEIARRLSLAGEEIAFVGVLDTWVLENTYNKFLYVEYYARRLRGSLRSGFRDQLSSFKKKKAGQIETVNPSVSLANPMRAYFPGPDFEPKTYAGRVSVFRTRNQPWNRIRDKALGWGTLALGGVDVQYVPGKHGAPVLREPHVQVVAAEIKKCLLPTVNSK